MPVWYFEAIELLWNDMWLQHVPIKISNVSL
jgi:hypothetical protein